MSLTHSSQTQTQPRIKAIPTHGFENWVQSQHTLATQRNTAATQPSTTRLLYRSATNQVNSHNTDQNTSSQHLKRRSREATHA
jgi:hypothetical protein